MKAFRGWTEGVSERSVSEWARGRGGRLGGSRCLDLRKRKGDWDRARERRWKSRPRSPSSSSTLSRVFVRDNDSPVNIELRYEVIVGCRLDNVIYSITIQFILIVAT